MTHTGTPPAPTDRDDAALAPGSSTGADAFDAGALDGARTGVSPTGFIRGGARLVGAFGLACCLYGCYPAHAESEPLDLDPFEAQVREFLFANLVVLDDMRAVLRYRHEVSGNAERGASCRRGYSAGLCLDAPDDAKRAPREGDLESLVGDIVSGRLPVSEPVIIDSETLGLDPFEARVRDFLLRYPEILHEMEYELEQSHLEAISADNAFVARLEWDILTGDPTDGRIGDGAPAFVQFVEYGCLPCLDNHSDVSAWLENNPGRSAVIKELPVSGTASETAARLALAIRDIYGNDDYAIIHNILITMSDPQDIDRVMDEVVAENWDIGKIRKGMQARGVTARIEAARFMARRLAIPEAPGFVFPAAIGRGFQDYQQIENGAATR